VINHTFTQTGIHNVSLTITDTHGLFNTTVSKIVVTFITDRNRDRTVNILDISIVAMAFGTKQGDENYNILADLDKNNEVNILDISTVAMDYGKTI